MSVSAHSTATAEQPPEMTAPRTALATVCISGTLEDKLDAAAAAGFDGVEIFEPDLVASALSPADIRGRCADLGLSIDLYQPFRDLDSTSPERFAANLRRAELKFDVMAELGTDLILVCSNASADAVADLDTLAEQLHTLADRAQARGVRVAYEALAWGREVSTYERSWDAVRLADHPSLGLCVDSFHILSRGSDPAGIADIPGEKLYFLQLADAPRMDMDVLQWSRHYRLFPGQGTFDLPAFLGYVLSAGYTGPLSLEVFNDIFRQSDPRRAAVDARRSLLALREAAVSRVPAAMQAGVGADAPPPTPKLRGYAFAELEVDAASGAAVADLLAGLGFTHTGRHRSKPVRLWQEGDARVLLNETGKEGAAVTALGIETTDPAAAARRATALLAPPLPQTHGPAEADLLGVTAPDGTAVFFCHTATEGVSWLADFVPTGATAPAHTDITTIDHVALTQPYDNFDEAALFYRSLLGLQTQHASEVAAPFGLVRNRAVSDSELTVRVCLSVSVLRRGGWAPGVADPQHIAFSSPDVIALARRARAAGAPLLDIPANYYDDLDARLAPSQIDDLRELGVLLDRDQDGEFLHFYTQVIGGRVFFEAVQRVDDYAGYGEANGPIRMAAHRRARVG
ncbi:MAG: 4-hydroxyphenylpyruvate dioxygenase [Pseudonocardiales bacterium]|nr:4-hydroxyphenylpyruvate dioxygenase [Pseudonocardiales bacterium]